ncbi:MAG: GspJ family type II secretion system protein [Desulfobacterales bacterium]|nr:GspJ family type II secretion system protein [Desulfobacterales bacterium]
MLKNRQAFTLLELIIALTIVGIILLIISGTFRIGIRAWEKGEKDIDKQQRYRIVLNLVQRQLTSITYKKAIINDKEQLILKGDSKSFEFTSHVSLKPENKFGIVYVKYMVVEGENETETLLAYEKNMVLFDKEFKFSDIDLDAFFELIPNIQGISFEYLKPPELGLEEEPEWQDKWDPENDQGLPLAVKLTVINEPEATPYVVIAPFYQQEE